MTLTDEMIIKDYSDDEEYGKQSYLASGNIMLRSKDYDNALKLGNEIQKIVFFWM